MNWFQKSCQSPPPSYLGVGHNYRWNEDADEYEEIWQSKGVKTTIIWYYKNGKIEEQQEEYDAHWIENEDARGRIEVDQNRGSVVFNNDNLRVQKSVLSDLVNHYPGVRFSIYGVPGSPISLQDYWTNA